MRYRNRKYSTILLYGCFWVAATAFADVTATIDPAVKHQTILGWGATASKGQISEYQLQRIVDAAVNELGLTRLRLEPPRREWEDPFNDDADANHIEWGAFKTGQTDRIIANVIAPFKRLVEANGDPFNLYVSPSFFDGGSSGSAMPWMLKEPEEYAEWATAYLLYLKNKHNITADYYCVCNEAGNNNAYSPQVVARMIKALGPRLRAAGLPTKIEFPEGVNAATSWRYIQQIQNDPDIWKYIGLVTYHLYGDAS